MVRYNYRWITEWDKEKLSERMFDLFGFIWSYIYLHWILIIMIVVSGYCLYQFWLELHFNSTFNFTWMFINMVVVVFGAMAHVGRTTRC